MRRAVHMARWAALVLLLAGAGCSRDSRTAPLVSPYDDDDSLGAVTAVWDNTGEERGFADSGRLKVPEVRFRYRLDARNRSGDKLLVRLRSMELVDEAGLALGRSTAQVDCTLTLGDTEGVLAGDIWIPKDSADKIRGFRVARFAVPLGVHQLQRYRDWLLQGRPNDAKQIDTEIAAQAGAPPCTGASGS